MEFQNVTVPDLLTLLSAQRDFLSAIEQVFDFEEKDVKEQISDLLEKHLSGYTFYYIPDDNVRSFNSAILSGNKETISKFHPGIRALGFKISKKKFEELSSIDAKSIKEVYFQKLLTKVQVNNEVIQFVLTERQNLNDFYANPHSNFVALTTNYLSIFEFIQKLNESYDDFIEDIQNVLS